jgi:hypothetical protein
MTNLQSRDKALSQVSDHNGWWKARALQELRWIRNQRLRHWSMYDQVFTFEDITKDLEYLIGIIPNPNLAGPIAKDAIERNIIEKTGVWVQTKEEGKNAREARQYRWKTY